MKKPWWDLNSGPRPWFGGHNVLEEHPGRDWLIGTAVWLLAMLAIGLICSSLS